METATSATPPRRQGDGKPRPTGLRSDGKPRQGLLRSAVTNGKRLHVVPPGDSAWGRRFRDVLTQIVEDIGSEGLTEGQRQLARRAATLCITCEAMEGEAAAGRPFDCETYGKITDRLGRTFSRLGLKQKSATVISNSFSDMWEADLQRLDEER